MRKFIAALAAAATIAVAAGAPAAQAETRLTGSGASFPFPIYSAWFKDFSATNSDGVTVDYQSKGSGAGIQDLVNGVVDFAASDAAMTDEEMAQVQSGVVLLPMTAGEVVLAYNLPEVAELKLPRDIYPEIFAGKIETWNDPRIAEANPGVELPDTPITVVVRSDSSGTTFNFTSHLAAIDTAFAEEVGEGKTVQWPSISRVVKAPKNDGVTATVMQTPGAIGYIEYGFAKMTGTPMATVENAAGEFVAPGGEGGALALDTAEFDTNMRAFITDPQGAGAYPMATFTWMLFYRSGQDEAKVAAIKDMIEYGLTTGQESAEELGYIPMPESVIEKVRAAAEQIGASS